LGRPCGGPLVRSRRTVDHGLVHGLRDAARIRDSGLTFHSNEVPSPSNPLGLKGAGEAGVIGAIPTIISAVADALRPLGVRHIDMPVTPERVWRAMRERLQVGYST